MNLNPLELYNNLPLLPPKFNIYEALSSIGDNKIS